MPSRVYLKRHLPAGAEGPAAPTVWQVPARRVRIRGAARPSGAPLFAVGFEVPQLPLGIYDAWTAEGREARTAPRADSPVKPVLPPASQSMTFEIKPVLRTPEAVVHGAVGGEVEVAVGVAGPLQVPASNGKPANQVQALVTLSGLGKGVAFAKGQSAHAATGKDGLARFKLHVEHGGQTELTAAAPGFDKLVLRVVGAPALELPMDKLEQGDVLLYVGTSVPLLLTQIIIDLEKQELAIKGGQPSYSHSGIYAGKNAQGVPEVIEMMQQGWIRVPLKDSISPALQVDVYRRAGLSAAQRARIVANAVSYNAAAAGDDPDDNLRYAYEEIAVLAVAHFDKLAESVRFIAGLADQTAGGKEAMICSELVAWAYHDAGVPLQVTPWKAIAADGVWTTLERRMDNTTPNMLGRSKSLKLQFRLK